MWPTAEPGARGQGRLLGDRDKLFFAPAEHNRRKPWAQSSSLSAARSSRHRHPRRPARRRQHFGRMATCLLDLLHALAAYSCGCDVDRPAVVLQFRADPSMPKIPDEQKPAIGKVIAPRRCSGSAGRARHRGHRPAARLDARFLVPALMLQPGARRDRRRHVARAGNGVQRLVHHLAEPEKGARIVQVEAAERPPRRAWPC